MLQLIPQEKISRKVIHKISSYYEYLWSVTEGHDEFNDILLKLPPQLMYSAMQERYSEAFENSLLFKKRDGTLDMALIHSFAELVRFQVFMPREFIIKAGSHGDGLIFIMEGQAVMMGLDNDVIAILRPGTHHHNEFGVSEKETYHGRRLFHLVSHQQTSIGFLDMRGIKKMFQAFPDW